MPYAPGVQDISGQLRAQGIAQAGNAWAQAIGKVGEDLGNAYQTFKQNQYMTNQALGKFAAASRADPSMLQFLESGGEQEDPNAPKIPVSQEVLKSYANIKNGKTSFNDAAVIGAFADAYQKNKNEVAQRQAVQSQAALHNLGALSQLADLGFYANQPGSAITPEMVESARRMITGGMGQGAPAANAAFMQPQGAQAPAGLAQFAPKAITAEQPSETPEIPKGAVATGRRSRDEQMAEALKVVSTLPPSQQRRSLNTVLADIQKRDLDLSKNYNFTNPSDAAAYAEQLNAQSKTPGIKFIVDTDPRTGYNIVKQTTSTTESPEDAARRKGMEVEVTKKAEDAVAYNKAITQAAQSSFDDMQRVDESLNLLKAGVPTGPGTSLANQWGSFLVRAGWASPEEVKANADAGTLQALLNRGAVTAAKRYASGQGSVSNFERQLFTDAVENPDKSPAANIRLLEMLKASHLKNRAAEAERQRLEDSDLSETQIYKAMRRWTNDDKNSLSRFGFNIGQDKNETRLNVQTNADGTVTASTKPQYAVGTVVKQGGKSYQFDGTNWNEVK